jgi:alkylhydroperoxidase/carboxymuconolactone decarboxylase family protein YurZ
MEAKTSSQDKPIDLTSFDELFSSPAVVERLKVISPTSYAAAAAFWRAPMAGKHLTARQKELIYFAMNASASALNVSVIERHTMRILAAGGTEEDIVDVLISIVALANHSLYASVPVLEDEWKKAGMPDEEHPDFDSNPVLKSAKERFVEIRGFWNSDREPVARQMPEYYGALSDIGTESWSRGSLSRKEREFICIGIDCTVLHTYEPGLRIHIRNAIREGATKGEILEIFQLGALLGLEGIVYTGEALARK